MSWEKVRGHDAVLERFRRSIARGRLGHGYLFCGPPGIGKRRLAIELAKALFCERHRPEELEACDRCGSCVQVAAGTHPDLFRVGRPADKHELPIATVQTLCHDLSLKSVGGRGKVAIIDDADDLNDEAANCFLKTLEEPPAGSLLILIGTHPELQLPTILSRCQVIRFQPLPRPLIEELLLRNETVDDPRRAELLARISDGSMERAEHLADPALWELRRGLLDGVSTAGWGPVPLMQAVTAYIESGGSESVVKRRRARQVIGLLLDFYRNLLRQHGGASPDLLDPADWPALDSLAVRLAPDTILALLERCLEAEYHIERRAHLVLAVEGMIDDLARLSAGRMLKKSEW